MTRENNFPSQPSSGSVSQTPSDRSMDEYLTEPDLNAFSPRESTIDLIDMWLQLRETKTESQLDDPDWQILEKAYMKHLEWRFDYPKKILNQQIAFSWIITLLVMVLVLAGIGFSYFQLNYALTVGDISGLSTEIAIQSAESLSFRSSLVGASVLLISLTYFYLYLRYVFSTKPSLPPHIALIDTDIPALFPKSGLVRRNPKRKKRSQTT